MTRQVRRGNATRLLKSWRGLFGPQSRRKKMEKRRLFTNATSQTMVAVRVQATGYRRVVRLKRVNAKRRELARNRRWAARTQRKESFTAEKRRNKRARQNPRERPRKRKSDEEQRPGHARPLTKKTVRSVFARIKGRFPVKSELRSFSATSTGNVAARKLRFRGEVAKRRA